jgi:hypothetical protein
MNSSLTSIRRLPTSKNHPTDPRDRRLPPRQVEADGAMLYTRPDRREAAMNVADWLRALGLEQYEAAFCENEVDVEVLPTLTADELKDIGVNSIRHRRRLLEAIAELRSSAMGPEAPALAPPSPPSDIRGQPGASEPAPERRPLSVMFCDLVGSTTLSSQLDPEDLREIIRSYQGCVATTIQHFDSSRATSVTAC